MTIIGITGTLGAGKGTVVEYLKTKYGFEHFSARTLITKEISNRGLEVNRDNMTEIANELRATHHPAYIIEELFEKAKSANQNSVLESVRTVGEIDLLRKKGEFYLFAIDANQRARYERIIARKSSTDNITLDKFVADEEREMDSEDPNKQNLRACIELADFKIINDGSLEDLHSQIDKVMESLKI